MNKYRLEAEAIHTAPGGDFVGSERLRCLSSPTGTPRSAHMPPMPPNSPFFYLGAGGATGVRQLRSERSGGGICQQKHQKEGLVGSRKETPSSEAAWLLVAADIVYHGD